MSAGDWRNDTTRHVCGSKPTLVHLLWCIIITPITILYVYIQLINCDEYMHKHHLMLCLS